MDRPTDPPRGPALTLRRLSTSHRLTQAPEHTNVNGLVIARRPCNSQLAHTEIGHCSCRYAPTGSKAVESASREAAGSST